MAAKGKLIWTAEKVERHEEHGYSGRQQYGKRSDGALVSNYKTYTFAGVPKNDYGWKLVKRAPSWNEEQTKANLTRNGYNFRYA